MPAILLTDMLYQLVREEPLKGLHGHEAQRRFSEIVRHSLDVFAKLTATNMLSEISWNEGERFVDVFNDDWTMLSNLVSNALLLALQPEGDDEESIRRLGEGWVAEETLAIAIYAVARHIDSFEDALITAVNHDGDSDSTGAVAGNIMGAIVGYDAIPEKFKKNLELHNVILTIANDLHQGVCRTLTAGR